MVKYGWKVEEARHGRRHVWPVGDLCEHELEGDDCICGPTLEPDGEGGWFVIHHPLDGREEPA